ncbi:MAG: hypothetical protein LJE93_13830 [Acidobacteria bacterium]|jgi:hypothetical protein|nr:hypothetical protein [Acidobacteriota bacterium]
MKGERKTARVLLRRADGQALEVLQAETGNQALFAKTETVERREEYDGVEAVPGDVWLELALEDDAPVGSWTGKVKLKTNHPIATAVDVPYAARVRPVIEPRPRGARLWSSPSGTGDGISAVVTLQNNAGEEFSVTAVKVSHPDVFSASAVSPKPGVRQMLRVELVPDARSREFAGTIEGWLRISTRENEREPVEVPVFIASSREGTLRGFSVGRRR